MPRYSIRKKLIAIGRDYVVEDAEGQLRWQVDGKVRFGTTFVLEAADGTAVAHCREKLMALDPTIVITWGDVEAARVRRTSTGDVPHTFEIAVAGEEPMRGRGSFLHGSIRIERGDGWIGTLALVRGEVVNETFHLDVSAGLDDALGVAVAMCLVSMDTYRGEHLSAT